MASQAVTILATEAGTKGWSAFWATSSLPCSSITSTVPDGASAATLSLTPASAGAGMRSRTMASRRDHMTIPDRDRALETVTLEQLIMTETYRSQTWRAREQSAAVSCQRVARGKKRQENQDRDLPSPETGHALFGGDGLA